MPEYLVSESWEDRTANVAAASGRQLARKLYVSTDDQSALSVVVAVNAIGNAAVMAAADPALDPVYIGTPHPEWLSALCDDIDPAPDPDDPSTVTVRLHYVEPPPVAGQLYGTAPPTSPPPPGTPARPASPAEPPDQPPEFSIDYVEVPKYLTHDLDGLPFVNAAGDPFEGVPPIEDTIAVIRYTVKKAAWQLADGAGIRGRINSGAWEGFAAHTLRVKGLSVRAVAERARSYYAVTYTIHWKEDGWRYTPVLNAGRRHKDAGGNLVNATDDMGRQTGAVSLLKANGTKAAASEFNFINFRLYQELDFDTL